MTVLILIAQLGILYLLTNQIARSLSAFLMQVTGKKQRAVLIYALLFLPGTFVHELSHLIMAKLLLVKAGHLSLWPQIKSDRIVLGSVQVVKADRVRQLLIGIAPGLLGLGIIFTAIWFYQQHPHNWYWLAALIYLIFQIGNSMFSSRSDMQGAVGLAVVVLTISAIAYYLGLRPSLSWVLPLLNRYQLVLNQAVLLLWWPILINIVVVVVLRTSNRLISAQ